MNVYAVKWVLAGAGSQEYNPYENEHRHTDLHGMDIVTCSDAERAYILISIARPLARVERPKLLGQAQ